MLSWIWRKAAWLAHPQGAGNVARQRAARVATSKHFNADETADARRTRGWNTGLRICTAPQDAVLTQDQKIARNPLRICTVPQDAVLRSQP